MNPSIGPYHLMALKRVRAEHSSVLCHSETNIQHNYVKFIDCNHNKRLKVTKEKH